MAENIAVARPSISPTAVSGVMRPIPIDKRAQALKSVDNDLIENKLAIRDEKTKGLKPSADLTARLSFAVKSSLPTPGVIVRACLDKCDSCEPLRKETLKLELEGKRLANQLLEKQIELLEKHADYRCCPENSSETPVVEEP